MPDDSNHTRSRLPVAERRLIRHQRWRLTVVSVVVLLCIWSAMSVVLYGVLRAQTLEGIDARLIDVARHLPGIDGGDPGSGSPISPQGPEARDIKDRDDDVHIIVWTKTHSSTYSSFGNVDSGSLKSALLHLVKQRPDAEGLYTIMAGAFPFRVYQSALSDQGQWMQVTAALGPELEVLHRLLVLYIVGGLLGLLLTALGGYALSAWTLRPLLAARKRERDLLMDVSHELRTPLTVAETHLDLLLRHVDDPLHEHVDWVAAVYGENRRMRRLVEDLLDLSRWDAGLVPLPGTPVDAHALCEEVAGVFQPVVVERGLSFATNWAEGPVWLRGDGMRLRQLLFILLDNACQYTDHGEIRMRLAVESGHAVIEVADTGIGIARDMVHKVTERFVRVDSARTRSGSMGLGLSIAQRIVEMHHGRLTFSSEPGVGTVVRVRFVAYRSAGEATGA